MLTHAVTSPAASRAAVQRCREKLRYDTQAQARATAMWMTILHNEEFIEYRCEADGEDGPHWHVAHAEPPPRKRKRGEV